MCGESTRPESKSNSFLDMYLKIENHSHIKHLNTLNLEKKYKL